MLHLARRQQWNVLQTDAIQRLSSVSVRVGHDVHGSNVLTFSSLSYEIYRTGNRFNIRQVLQKLFILLFRRNHNFKISHNSSVGESADVRVEEIGIDKGTFRCK